MLTDALLELRREAAEPVNEHIRAVRARLDYPEKRLLEYLPRGLFNVTLTVDSWFEICGFQGSNSVREAFQNGAGLTPSAFLEEARMEVAMRVLRLAPGTRIDALAVLVGYRHAKTFYNAFMRFCGQPPAVYRQRLRELAARNVPAPDPSRLRGDWLERLGSGRLSRSELHRLRAEVEVAYGLEPGAVMERRLDRQDFERRLARYWWSRVGDLPVGALRAEVHKGFRFRTLALVELLLERSREEGRDDRAAGVEIADLALRAARKLEEFLEESIFSHVEARALAWLANARCLALDFSGAEKVFAAVHERFERHPPPAELHAEVLYLESCLRRYQHRFGEALDLAEQAVSWCSPGHRGLRTEVLLGRGAVYWHLGAWRQAAKDFREGLRYVDPETQPYLTWSAHHNLGTALVGAGKLTSARRWLRRAARLAERLGQRGPLCKSLWAQGLLAAREDKLARAEEHLRTAWEGLEALGEEGLAAVAALDLASFADAESRHDEALAWVAEALPTLEALELGDESVRALELLRRGIAAQTLERALLVEVRATVAGVVGAPAV